MRPTYTEGLPGIMCPPEPDDEAPELGPTFRYVEWDFTEEHGAQLVRGHHELCTGSLDLNDEDDDEDEKERENRGGGEGSGGEDDVDGECDVAAYSDDFAFAAKMAKAKGLTECTIGEDEDGMPALDCPVPSGH